MLILLILFIVAMFLWLVTIIAPVPPPFSNARALLAWFSVLFLALLTHVVHFP